MQQLRAKTKSLTFPSLSKARYSFIQLSRPGRQWRERKCPIVKTVAKGDLNPGSLDYESGVLSLSYRAPLHWYTHINSAPETTKMNSSNIRDKLASGWAFNTISRQTVWKIKTISDQFNAKLQQNLFETHSR